VILIGDVHVVTSPDVIAYVDREVTNYATAPTDQASITYADNWVCQTLLSWHHPSRERYVATNHR
jgi:hypothetical protein